MLLLLPTKILQGLGNSSRNYYFKMHTILIDPVLRATAGFKQGCLQRCGMSPSWATPDLGTSSRSQQLELVVYTISQGAGSQ